VGDHKTDTEEQRDDGLDAHRGGAEDAPEQRRTRQQM
jgi:hypothetical protein